MQNTHEIIAIAALGKDTRAIGKNNNLLWNIPGDLPRFKAITTGHPVIMGFATFESMGKRLLPNRTNIILTYDSSIHISGAYIVHSKEEALEIAKKSEGSEEIFIIGGGQIYTLFLPETDTLDLTLVHDTQDGDVFFPDYSEFSEIISEEQCANENITFTRRKLKRP